MPSLLGQISPERRQEVTQAIEGLTDRQIQVLRDAVSGWTARDSAKALGISSRSVELYRGQILAKLRARNMTEAVALISLAGC